MMGIVSKILAKSTSRALSEEKIKAGIFDGPQIRKL